MSGVGKSVATSPANSQPPFGAIVVSALRQEPANNSGTEGGCGEPSLHPGDCLIFNWLRCAVNMSALVCSKERGRRGLILPSVLRFTGDAGVSQPDVPPTVGVINYVLLVFQHMC